MHADQALLYPLAFLFAEHTDAVLHVLADAPDTLAGVAARWAAELGHVHGTFVLNVHILGAAQLLDRWPRALETMVDGDPLPAPDGVIVTRSRARAAPQYARISAGAKMIKELVGLYEQTESHGHQPDVAAAAESDDEWCDEPVEYNGACVVLTRPPRRDRRRQRGRGRGRRRGAGARGYRAARPWHVPAHVLPRARQRAGRERGQQPERQRARRACAHN